MAVTAERLRDGVPYDTFGTRLAIVRQTMGGWNVKKAADFFDIDDQTWRNWEAGKNPPRNLEDVCRRISRKSGFDFNWLMVGGPLIAIRCITEGAEQGTLFETVAWNQRADLSLVGV